MIAVGRENSWRSQKMRVLFKREPRKIGTHLEPQIDADERRAAGYIK